MGTGSPFTPFWGGAGDPQIELHDESGAVVASDDDSGGNLNAQIIFVPAQTGPYRIIATSFDEGDIGIGRFTLM